MPPKNNQVKKPLKVLWFVNTPSLAAEKYGIKSMPTGSWISAAEAEMRKRKDIILAVAFLIPRDKTQRFVYQNRTYYTVRLKDHTFSFVHWLNRITHSLGLCKIQDLLWVIDDFKPNIIHVYGSESSFGLIAGQTEVPVVLRVQGVLQVYRKSIERTTSSLKVFLGTKVNFLVFTYGLLHYRLLFKRRAVREEKIFNIVKYYIGQTDWDERLIQMLSLNSKYFRLNPSVRKEFFKHKWQKKRGRELSILSVISPNPYKGLEEILEAAKMMKKKGTKFSWKIAGIAKDDPYAKAFWGLKKDYFPKYNIYLLGVLDEKELIREYLKSDIFVHPSHLENECLSVIEAMTLGIPIVSNFVGGIGTYLKDGETGIMVQDKDSLGLAATIISLKNDPIKAGRMGEKARQIAKKVFNNDSSVKKLIKIYREILELEARR